MTLSYTRCARAHFPSEKCSREKIALHRDVNFRLTKMSGNIFWFTPLVRARALSVPRRAGFPAALRDATRKNFDKPRIVSMRCYRDRKEFLFGRFPVGNTPSHACLSLFPSLFPLSFSFSALSFFFLSLSRAHGRIDSGNLFVSTMRAIGRFASRERRRK